MIVVIDTNVLLPALCTTNESHQILEAWMLGKFAWALTSEILFEYEEIARPRIGDQRWQHFLTLMDRVGALRQNVVRVSPTFRFRQIVSDHDDDKFADCAIAAEVDWIVTSDRHFDALIGSGYKPQPITPAEFIERHL
ncbi:MAG: putative nucleic acid-binding protein [Verrucomicrobiaceae bacterium]|nr:putative nucleic acid-binding protein [Verrucomicrobiaceae bacterium]